VRERGGRRPTAQSSRTANSSPGLVPLSVSRLRALRKKVGWSQSDLAREARVSLSTIRRVERNGACRHSNARAIAKAFDVPLAEVLALPFRQRICGRLRPPTQTFVGRDAALVELERRLVSRAGIKLALEGRPGIGKTELALQLIHRLEQTTAFRILWLDGRNPDLTDEWTEVVAPYLGITDALPQQRLRRVLDALSRSELPLLIVLDNVTSWSSATPWPRPRERSQIHWLITTRYRIVGQGFVHWHVPDLDLAASRELLTRIAPRTEITPEIEELLAELGGYTIAVEMAAVFFKSFGDSEPPKLPRRRSLDPQDPRSERAAHQTRYQVSLDHALEALFDLLPRATRRAWQLAAWFADGPVSIELSDTIGLGRELRARLHAAHLIELQADDTWVMHGLIRAFGRDRSAPEPPRELQRTFVLGCWKALREHSETPISIYLRDPAQLDLAVVHSEEALPLADELGFLTLIGPTRMGYRGFRLDDERSLYTRAYACAEQLADPSRVFRTLESYWQSSLLLGHWSDAQQLTEAIERSGHHYHGQTFELTLYRTAGERCLYTGQLEAASDWLGRGVALEDPDLPHLAHLLDAKVALQAHYALACCVTGRSELAQREIAHALERAHDLGLNDQLFARLFEAGIHQIRGDTESCIQAAEKLFRLDDGSVAPIFFNLCRLHWSWAQIASARAVSAKDVLRGMQGHIEQLRALGFRVAEPYYVGLVADASLRSGDLALSSRLLEEALSAVAASGEGAFGESEIWRLRARLEPTPLERRRALAHALRIATRQGARLFGLRAALDAHAVADSEHARAEAARRALAFARGCDPDPEIPELRRALELQGAVRA